MYNESIELEEGKFLDSKSINYKRQNLESYLGGINANYDNLILSTKTGAITSSTFTVANYTIKEDGTYILAGVLLPNAYGQENRDLIVKIYKNTSVLQTYSNVFNLYVWTYSCPIICIAKFRKNDVLKIAIESGGKSFAFHGGQLTILKLNNETY